MTSTVSRPLALNIVAALFILTGVSATLQVVALAAHGHYNINLSILSVFIGIGLLKLNPTWRKVAVIYTYFYIVEGAVAVIVFLLSAGQTEILGPMMSPLAPLVRFLLSVLLVGLGAWQLSVLNSRQVRGLFHRSPQSLGVVIETQDDGGYRLVP